MVTPVFRILDYLKALEFYVDWLGFRIDWEEGAGTASAYLQVSRGDIVLHLSENDKDSSPGARARLDMRGLPAYHHQLVHKSQLFAPSSMAPAPWSARVLEMEVVDPFGNCLVFCEATGLQG